MIPEIGHYALVLALALGVIQSVAPVIGAIYRDGPLMRLANSTAIIQFVFVAASSFAAMLLTPELVQAPIASGRAARVRMRFMSLSVDRSADAQTDGRVPQSRWRGKEKGPVVADRPSFSLG